MPYNDSQPRDENGQWTSGGGGGGGFPPSAAAAYKAAGAVSLPGLGTKKEHLARERSFVKFKKSQGISLPRGYLKGQASFWDFKLNQIARENT